MHHLYLSIYNDAAALQQEREALVAWCVENGVKDYDFIEDNLTIGRILEKRIKALLEPIKHGDTIVASEMSRLGRSLSMFQTVMNHIWNNECTIITLEGRTMEPNRTMTLFVNALNDIVELERQMKGFRSKDVLQGRREDGVTLGLPRGVASGISHAARAFSLPPCRRGPCKQFEAHGLTAFGLSPHKSLQERAPDGLARKKPSALR